jgi:hypothetical protein
MSRTELIHSQSEPDFYGGGSDTISFPSPDKWFPESSIVSTLRAKVAWSQIDPLR